MSSKLGNYVAGNLDYTRSLISCSVLCHYSYVATEWQIVI